MEITVLPPETQETALAVSAPNADPSSGLFRAFYAGYENQASHQLRLAWTVQRDAWLRANRKGRPSSPATRRAYASATTAFQEFTGVDWWLVTPDHVRAWQEHMRDQGLSEATINQRLSAVSSFYSWVIREQKLGADGVERSLFFDAHGRTRANPFRANNLERITPSRQGHSRAISQAVIIHMIGDINVQTLEGARDSALLLTFLLTGWRSAEVLKLRWGDIRPNDDRPGEYICAWSGKGSKAQDDPFPARAYHAIIHYLKVAGRWLPGHPDQIANDAYIWLPIRTHGLQNFPNVGVSPEAKHISPAQANNILRKHIRRALRRTGLTKEEAAYTAVKYHIHNLRHTFAHNMRKAKFDVLAISKRMHHSSIAVTQLYLDSLEAPVDDYSQALQLAMGI